MENSPIQPEPRHPSTWPTLQQPPDKAQGGQHHPSPGTRAKLARQTRWSLRTFPGPREKAGLIPVPPLPWRACRLESHKTVFTTQLAAINYSRPRFPQTHRLSLLARSFLDSAQQPCARLSSGPLFISFLPRRPSKGAHRYPPRHWAEGWVGTAPRVLSRPWWHCSQPA